jgi:hypothetical protein
MHGSTAVHRLDLVVARRRNGTASAAPAGRESGAPAELPEDALQWSWPPYAPVETDDEPFDTAEWAPSSVVWHPQVRVGRWTVVYRRCA